MTLAEILAAIFSPLGEFIMNIISIPLNGQTTSGQNTSTPIPTDQSKHDGCQSSYMKLKQKYLDAKRQN